MADATLKVLNHFSVCTFKDAYWQLSPGERADVQSQWIVDVGRAAGAIHSYQVFPAQRADFMVWSAVSIDSNARPSEFFRTYAMATSALRRYVEPTEVLWGMTKPSPYAKGRSGRQMDPFGVDRSSYLVVYPFVKTADWYRMNHAARQGMMNEHISIGKQYRDIRQLLLYSFGLQDQEFVVVYETDDLSLFSQLVADLRDTEARRYTQRDTPLHTGVLRSREDLSAVWGS